MSTINRQQEQLKKLFEKLELNEKQAGVFLKLLSLGKATAGELAKGNRHMARTSVYDVLKNLAWMGLVSSFVEEEKQYFQVQDAEHIIDALEYQKKDIAATQDLLRSVGDGLQQMKSGSAYHPRVRYFEGENGILAVHRELLKTCKETRAIGDMAAVARVFPRIVVEDNLEEFHARKVPMYSLLIRNREAEKYMKVASYPGRHFKWLPGGTRLETDTFIWEGHVAILDYSANLSGVIIDNPTIADTFLTWFELIWKGCGEEVGRKRGVL